jgi:hypothetical protein
MPKLESDRSGNDKAPASAAHNSLIDEGWGYVKEHPAKSIIGAALAVGAVGLLKGKVFAAADEEAASLARATFLSGPRSLHIGSVYDMHVPNEKVYKYFQYENPPLLLDGRAFSRPDRAAKNAEFFGKPEGFFKALETDTKVYRTVMTEGGPVVLGGKGYTAAERAASIYGFRDISRL